MELSKLEQIVNSCKRVALGLMMLAMVNYVAGCSKKNPTQNGPPPDPRLADIWQTDASGNTIKPDNTDWVSDSAVIWGNPYPYPNPATDSIMIPYTTLGGKYNVKLWITRKNDTTTIATLVNGQCMPGSKKFIWNLTGNDSNKVTEGLYTAHLTAGDTLTIYTGKGDILVK